MHKELVYLKGFAKGRQYWQMLKAVQVAVYSHDGQTRKTGVDYVEHPMKVTSELVALKVYDEITLTAALLHDVLEDCDTTYDVLLKNYGFSEEIIGLVVRLTKRKGIHDEVYYSAIARDIRAVLIKVSDRCHNISTMTGAFSLEKMQDYVSETEKYILPMCKTAIIDYPQYSDEITLMRYHIRSMLGCIKWFLENPHAVMPIA